MSDQYKQHKKYITNSYHSAELAIKISNFFILVLEFMFINSKISES